MVGEFVTDGWLIDAHVDILKLEMQTVGAEWLWLKTKHLELDSPCAAKTPLGGSPRQTMFAPLSAGEKGKGLFCCSAQPAGQSIPVDQTIFVNHSCSPNAIFDSLTGRAWLGIHPCAPFTRVETFLKLIFDQT